MSKETAAVNNKKNNKAMDELLAEIDRINNAEMKMKEEAEYRKKSFESNYKKTLELLDKADKELHGNEFDSAKNVKSGISWLKRFFSGIFGYFFGEKKTNELELDFAKDLNEFVEKTSQGIKEGLEELKKKPEDERNKGCIEMLENLQKEMEANNGVILNTQDAVNSEYEKNYPGALGGEDLKNELTELSSMLFDVVAKYGQETNTLYLQSFAAKMVFAVGSSKSFFDIPPKSVNFDSPEEVEAYLNEAVNALEQVEDRTKKEIKLQKGPVPIKLKYKETLISTILIPFKNKLKAIDENKLLKQGETPKSYKPRSYESKQLEEAFGAFKNEKEIERIKYEIEIYPEINALKSDMQMFSEKIENDIREDKNPKTLIGTIQAYMYISNLYAGREKKKKMR